jgi:cytochrome c peroxidase
MQGREISDQQVADLAAYVRTLKPPASVDQLRGDADQKLIARGKQVFASRDCANCHTPPLYTSAETYDVGIHDKQGNTQFNPPSLRGVGQRGPYFHNAGAEKLEDVFVEHGHQLDGRALSDDELQALVAFLRSL